MAEEIDLQTFMQALRLDVDRFAKFWRDNSLTMPQNFPRTMGIADWWEQFSMFAEDSDAQ